MIQSRNNKWWKTLRDCFFFGALMLIYIPAFAGIIPVNLRCEYLINPIGIDVVRPGLSWRFESNVRGQLQTVCHVLVASSEDKLRHDTAFTDYTYRVLYVTYNH